MIEQINLGQKKDFFDEKEKTVHNNLLFRINETRNYLGNNSFERLLYVLDIEYKKSLDEFNDYFDEKLELLNEFIITKRITQAELDDLYQNVRTNSARICIMAAMGRFNDIKITQKALKYFHNNFFNLSGKGKTMKYLLAMITERKERMPSYILAKILENHSLITEDILLKIFSQYSQKGKSLSGYFRQGKDLLEDSNYFYDEYDGNMPVDLEINIQQELLKQLKKNGTRKSADYFLSNMLDIDNFLYNRKPIIELIKKIDLNYSMEKLLSKLATSKTKTDTTAIVLILTDLMGAEATRQELNKKIEIEKNAIKKDSFEYASSLITPNDDKIAIVNLQRFYQEKIKFEDNKINQEINPKEVELLQKLIGKNEKVLEEGCGTGRLLLEMKKAGYDITGFDFTARHTEIIKEQNPEIKVLRGDWHQTGFKDESFDTVYSLGRNILHDYSVADQVQLFREANRILKPGGKFIFDIPEREKGGYKQMVDEYGEEMKWRGIRNFRYGSIYDSPDGINFATRYAYSKDDIRALAQLAGFKIAEMRQENLPTGKEDENLYFVLEKI